MTNSRYEQLYIALVSARQNWSREANAALGFARDCRKALVEYYGCSQNQVELQQVKDAGLPERHKVNPFLESDEKEKCWRFSLRVTVRNDPNPLHEMSFTTEFRLRKTQGGYKIAAGEPQLWHKVSAPTATELQELFDSINDWIMEYLTLDESQYGSPDKHLIGFR